MLFQSSPFGICRVIIRITYMGIYAMPSPRVHPCQYGEIALLSKRLFYCQALVNWSIPQNDGGEYVKKL